MFKNALDSTRMIPRHSPLSILQLPFIYCLTAFETCGVPLTLPPVKRS